MPVAAQRGCGGTAPTHSQPSTRRRWVINAIPWSPYPQQRCATHCTGDWVSLGVGLDGTENLIPLGFDPQTVQPVTSHYTNYAIPAGLDYVIIRPYT
jgi:hypothetical protein